MNKYILSALSVCSGILCGLAWTDWCPGLILLVGFVPFLIIENYLYENSNRYSANSLFLYILPGFVIFSILTLGWIRVISLTAAICIILISSCIMASMLWLAHKVRVNTGIVQGCISLVAFWLTMEFLCLRIEILSPWINLGNGLSKDILFIQWYEITGTAGGTVWILLSNLFLSIFLLKLAAKRKGKFMYLSLWLTVLILPSAISIIRFETIKITSGYSDEVVIVQPNFDPYEEKFTIPFAKQLERTIEIAETAISDDTDWLLTPETTIDDPVNETNLMDNTYIKTIKEFVKKRPTLSVVAGMVSYNKEPSPDETGSTLNRENYYNTAFKIDTSEVIEIYHKSRLVPGFEYVPSKGFFRLISRTLPRLGAINRSYTGQKIRSCFWNSDKSQKIAPVICYESVYGDYVTDYIKKGAGAIFIITNDGWWKNTKGYSQHLSYSSLRAIETRRPVIRAANTGISCILDVRGKIIQGTRWWVPAVVKGNFNYENRITPYVKYGDYLMYMASIISILTLCMIYIFRLFSDKFNK